jgi:hypothetical protein
MTILDGNALAGDLADVLGDDPTSARLRCAECGSAGALGETRVHRSAMGAVVRCRACGTVLVTVVVAGNRRRVGMPGVRAADIW